MNLLFTHKTTVHARFLCWSTAPISSHLVADSFLCRIQNVWGLEPVGLKNLVVIKTKSFSDLRRFLNFCPEDFKRKNFWSNWSDLANGKPSGWHMERISSFRLCLHYTITIIIAFPSNTKTIPDKPCIYIRNAIFRRFWEQSEVVPLRFWKWYILYILYLIGFRDTSILLSRIVELRKLLAQSPAVVKYRSFLPAMIHNLILISNIQSHVHLLI